MGNRVVFGTTSAIINWLDSVPGALQRVLSSFPNTLLVSTIWASAPCIKKVYDIVGKDRLYLDSGGFTLYKDETKLGADSEEFKEKCEKVKRKFLRILKSGSQFDEVFELDNEYFRKDEDLLSPNNYLRKEIKEICGFYPTPVFKMFQGFEYWKRLCDSDLYPKLAIGGLAQTRTWHVYRSEVKKMMQYARMRGKKVHLLGCSNVETCREVLPDTLDYDITRYAINFAELQREHPEIKEWKYKEYRLPLAIKAISNALCSQYLYDERQDEYGEE